MWCSTAPASRPAQPAITSCSIAIGRMSRPRRTRSDCQLHRGRHRSRSASMLGLEPAGRRLELIARWGTLRPELGAEGRFGRNGGGARRGRGPGRHRDERALSAPVCRTSSWSGPDRRALATGRWDSLVANGPAWHDRFPGLEFSDVDPDAFASKDQVADYFVAYAEKIAAPIRCGVEVTSVRRNAGRPGFRAETSDGIDRRRLRGGRDRAVPAAGDPRRRPRGCRAGAAPLERLPQPGAAAGRRGPRRRGGVVRGADRGRAAARRAARLPLRRPPRPAAAAVSRPRLLLVARRARQVGCRDAAARRRARHDRGQRRRRRAHRRLPRPRRARHGAARPEASYENGTLRFAPDSATTSPRATPTTCRCSTRPTRTSTATGLDLPEEPEARVLGPMPGAA